MQHLEQGSPIRHTIERFAVLLTVLLTTLSACGSSEPSSGVPAGPLGKADSNSSGISKAEFFAPNTFYFIRIKGWDPARMSPASLAEALEIEGAELSVYRSNARSPAHCPEAEVNDADLVYESGDFSLRTSGNFTNGMPKSSYKIKFTEKKSRLFKMKALNLKSMWNDVSQMREALAWTLFQRAGVIAPRQTYAKFCINGRYYGLYSMIEQVDKSMLEDHLDKNDKGNLYKAYWADIGPANLTHRVAEDGDDSGRQYYTSPDMDERTYQLKTNEDSDDDPAHQTYDDLAQLIRTIDGVGIPESGDARFNSDAFHAAVERVLDVKGFLRWASLNMLLGAWDNYYATPANYYLYNSGKQGGRKDFMEQPYFHLIPWDYDHSMGIDYFHIAWQANDIVDWEQGTVGYYPEGKTSQLPLITHLLKNRKFLAYYLDHMEYLLDSYFNESWFMEQIGEAGSGGLWDRVSQAAFLEADGPRVPAHTGRQFTNDQVYWNGFQHHELSQDARHTHGILHYVRMRHDSARTQLETWRETVPAGSSGITFPEARTPLPDYLETPEG